MAQLNQEVRHAFDVKLAGSPVTGLVEASFTLLLLRQAGTEIVTATEDLTVEEIDSALFPGLYWIYYTPVAGLGVYRLTIAKSGGYVITPSEFQVTVDSTSGAATGPYLTTRANIREAFPQLGVKDDPLIDALLPAVTEYIHAFCGKKYTQEILEEFHSARGWNAQTLNLDRYPIASIAAVHVSPSLPRVWDSGTLLNAGTDYTYEAKSGILRRIGGGIGWPFEAMYGDGAVRVQYTAGFSVIPAHVERAAIEIIAVKVFKSQKGLYHVTDEQIGQGQVQGVKWDDVTPHAREVLNMERSVAA